MSAEKDHQLSKSLSWLLRHGALKEGLHISTDGYVNVDEVLHHRSLRGKYTEADVKRVVETNDKKRFTLRYKNNILEICANQGHSLTCVEDLNLIPILAGESVEAIHGTFYSNWDRIKTEGIKRMRRNHIHFAAGLPGDKTIISGIRRKVQVLIYIDLNLSISEGLKFYKSANGVILSPGNDSGIIEPKYFLKVCDINGKILN